MTEKKEITLQWNKPPILMSRSKDSILNPPPGVMIERRFPKMMRYLGGFRPHELTLLCAPTGSGKTALIATIASEVAGMGTPVFAAPVETGDVDFMTRVIGANVGYELNTGGDYLKETVEKVFGEAERTLSGSPLTIASYDSRVHIDEMVAVLEVMSLSGVKLALLDNLNFFLEITSTDYERAVMDDAIHKLVMFTKRNPMHVILIVHPRKTDGGRITSEFDLKGSATSVQECSNVMLFNRPTQDEVENGGRNWSQRELVFKKIRKRGMFVNMPIWYEYRHGGYHECC